MKDESLSVGKGNYNHKPHTEERKKKISDSMKGKKNSLESRKKQSKSTKGISKKQVGQFKEGHTPWNYKGEDEVVRKVIRINGKRILQSHYNYITYYGLKEIPKGFVIHHIDENPLNDDIKNLRLMRSEDHHFLHNMLDKQKRLLNDNVQKLMKRNTE